MFEMAVNLTETPVKTIQRKYLQEDNTRFKEIVLLDDEYVNYLYFNEMLTGTSFRIIRAITLEQALVKITQSNDVKAIVVSCSTIGNNGADAIRVIKHLFTDLPVIAIIDSDIFQNHSNCHFAGADTYLNRHTNREHLVEIMEDLLSNCANLN